MKPDTLTNFNQATPRTNKSEFFNVIDKYYQHCFSKTHGGHYARAALFL
jgi:hypothetical protein